MRLGLHLPWSAPAHPCGSRGRQSAVRHRLLPPGGLRIRAAPHTVSACCVSPQQGSFAGQVWPDLLCWSGDDFRARTWQPPPLAGSPASRAAVVGRRPAGDARAARATGAVPGSHPPGGLGLPAGARLRRGSSGACWLASSTGLTCHTPPSPRASSPISFSASSSALWRRSSSGTLVTGIAGPAESSDSAGADGASVARLGWKSLVYFEVLTTAALAIGLVAINLSRAGVGVAVQAGRRRRPAG